MFTIGNIKKYISSVRYVMKSIGCTALEIERTVERLDSDKLLLMSKQPDFELAVDLSGIYVYTR